MNWRRAGISEQEGKFLRNQGEQKLSKANVGMVKINKNKLEPEEEQRWGRGVNGTFCHSPRSIVAPWDLKPQVSMNRAGHGG